MPRAVLALVYVVLATVTSVPAFSKYTAWPGTLAAAYFVAIALCVFYVYFRRPVTTALSVKADALMASALCLGLAAANAVLYPRTRLSPVRSTAPDALIEPARRLMAGVHPYAGVLFDGAPISAGPGWIALHAPLVLAGLVWLIVPLHLWLASRVVARQPPYRGVPFIALMCVMPAFVQMSLVGHDLFAVGCAMVTVTIGMYHQTLRPTRGWILWSLAAAIVGTARVPLAIFTAVLAALVWRADARLGKRVALLSGVALVAIHLGVMWWGATSGVWYQPLHVFGRASRAGATVLAIGATLSLALSVWLWRRDGRSVSDWLCLIWTTAGLPFVAVGLNELINTTRGNWSGWEGKVYAGFAVPLLIAALHLSSSDAHARD